jgi:hypothetical protein
MWGLRGRRHGGVHISSSSKQLNGSTSPKRGKLGRGMDLPVGGGVKSHFGCVRAKHIHTHTELCNWQLDGGQRKSSSVVSQELGEEGV